MDTTVDYVARRERLLRRMGQGVAIIPTATEKTRNADAHYRFRHNSDFYYLTGFPEPEAVLVLAPGHPLGSTILFVRPRDPAREIWDGYRAGLEGAREQYGADQVFSIHEINDILPGFLENQDLLFYSVGRNPDFDARVMHWLNQARAKVRAGISAPREIVDVDEMIHEMRLIKDDAEIELMRRAAGISGAAHRQAMRVCRPGLYEYELEAELEYVFRRQGATAPAYTSIVGGGVNACVLHYIENSRMLADGDLVLIDAGAEYGGYAADITRTFPVNGRFSPEQRDLYALVLAAQQAAIEAVRPGSPYNAYHDAAVAVLAQGLLDLGIIRGSLEESLETGSYKPFYMHRTGHWLGMDVHDVGAYKLKGEWRPLQAGMVLTVEPGLYIAPDAENVDARWRGIGIRIEDDVLVTENGHDILTKDTPKRLEEIEDLMGQAAPRLGLSAEELALFE
ncbi:Xaa-Pro aminopeptidase [Thermithiobacillus plumbiphilus]|uniref:Xaa-Pro aminopeptidase n=1 Tax=Thermithiobacillus plumbiphilus TaxID=1729899 RepID=A0ABU9D4W7_9PROT